MPRTSTTWVKGQVTNPHGRPKKIDELEALAREHTPAAIEALAAALKQPRERVAAASILLDRAWGKPKQMIMGDKDRPLIVDFRWADAPNEVIADVTQKVIEATVEEEEEAETEVVWQNGGK